MSLEYDPIQAHVVRALLAHHLFAGLGSTVLQVLAAQMSWLALPGGGVLFDQGSDSDGMYLLLTGRLCAARVRADGQIRDLGHIVPGETIGETGLIADEARNARIFAIRDSEMLFLSRDGFEHFSRLHPESMLRLARIALRRSYVSAAPKTGFTSYAVLPASRETQTAEFARSIAAALGEFRPVRVLDAGGYQALSPQELANWESEGGQWVYQGDHDPLWRERCVRQADCVLLVADANRPAQLHAPLALPDHAATLPLHRVLLHSVAAIPGSTDDWLQRLPQGLAHHHICGQADVHRLARRLTARAVGLVLSGGGARGFAHLGVIRALREAGQIIDYVGGCSIGAIIGAGLAAGWSDAEMRARYRDYLVTSNPLADWTLPVVSLRSGSRVSARLRAAFGQLRIEDLPLPFFCVSANLSEGALEVHEQGGLWQALRASSAIPGILPPVFTSGLVLVDGGVIDNLPVDEMRKRLAGDIIAVDVGGHYRLRTEVDETELPPWWRLLGSLFGQRKRPTIGQILLRSGMVNSLATTQRRRRQTHLLINPQLEGIELLDWHAFDRAEAAGYEHTCALMESGEVKLQR